MAGPTLTTTVVRRRGAKRNPELTRERILEASFQEFAANGLDGARVDAIAERAGANKRMIYHYFGSKDELFLAVLERAYERIRARERELDLEGHDPITAIRDLVAFTFHYFAETPEFIRLLNNENRYQAAHLKRSKRLRELHSPLVHQLEAVLTRGAAQGVFRGGVDPVQLYITIAGVTYFYFSNVSTLATIFGRELLAPSALEARLEHAVEVVLGYLRP